MRMGNKVNEINGERMNESMGKMDEQKYGGNINDTMAVSIINKGQYKK